MAHRAQVRLTNLTHAELQKNLEETLYYERKRLERTRDETEEIRRADALSKALVRGVHADQIEAAMRLYQRLDRKSTVGLIREYIA